MARNHRVAEADVGAEDANADRNGRQQHHHAEHDLEFAAIAVAPPAGTDHRATEHDRK